MDSSVSRERRNLVSAHVTSHSNWPLRPVNNNSRTSNCQSDQFSSKHPIVRHLCSSGWLIVPINPDKWSYILGSVHKESIPTCCAMLLICWLGIRHCRSLYEDGILSGRNMSWTNQPKNHKVQQDCIWIFVNGFCHLWIRIKAVYNVDANAKFLVRVKLGEI